ncbi:hypothetical protein OCK74_13625 [Chitinophagaceae bacterium LB-8]|uniref:Beta-hexosaminidase bacterial type N-terminal domain-containing protein n=1 Tax=Paraflavisolibacter caeni TaxID=2982496 RepID=A0A9X2XYZ3_9BACT|nr:hypothetical protein [Paraflavisolibacter caeni]MCU7550158.1 hypothetical protein [Paraflavisolibacter caeni]
MKKIAISILLFWGMLYCSKFQTVHAQKTGDKKTITLVIPPSAHPRIQFGAEKLSIILQNSGYTVKQEHSDKLPKRGEIVVIGKLGDELWKKSAATYGVQLEKVPGKEGFTIVEKKNAILIGGADETGTLYGCLELADKVKEKGILPDSISVTDQPEMVLRGACVGVQKPTYLPGRGVYEYPYTPETFPWLYDKALWISYLDSLVENRMNSLYLWNGHPFSSLVRLKDYPYAVEVDDATFKKNEEIFRFLTEEANKRGIWVIQMFYNIIIPKPFAEKHGLKTQDRDRPIIPIIADYTQKSIAAFVEKYPNVGLLITLGEAMEGVGQDDVDWFTKTIIPGVQDGLRALGRKDEPPIVLRAHDTDAPRVMKAALPLYKNLFTMAKYNGEALTTYTPRGPWAELHRSLSAIGTVHIQNVHILANLEPFRYGSADFIQKSVKAMHDIYGSNGLHLYPQASYWDWPYAADNTGKRLLQIERDWIWYKAWARYAWNCRRDRNNEISYWSNLLGNKFGTDALQGKNILTAYEETGEIAPKLLRRYGITDGNRQTLTLGMLMSQLINPFKYSLFTLLYNSEAPEGEMIIEYADKEWKKQGHIGETPVQVAKEVVAHGQKAVEAVEKAAPSVQMEREEFTRLKNDVYCYNALANFYAEKVKAALWILHYKYSNDINDLEKALPFLEKSVVFYSQLTDLTKETYLYANSMQTAQRKIPIRGVNGTFKTWVEVLPVFKKELDNFRKNIDSLKSIKYASVENTILALKNANVTLPGNTAFYSINEGQQVYADTALLIKAYAGELKGLKGIKMDKAKQIEQGTSITFSTTKPVKLLVGYFTVKNTNYLKAPELETDANANEYGQDEIKIGNAVVAGDLPPINVHTYAFNKGTHTLTLGKGMCLLLGFIDGNQVVRMRDAGLGASDKKDIDWLFD